MFSRAIPLAKSFAMKFALASALFFHVVGTAQAQGLHLIMIDTAKPGIDQVLPAFDTTYHYPIEIEVVAAEKIIARIEAGNPGDVLILDAASLEKLEARKRLRTLDVAELGRAGLGVAVKQGKAVPPVFTEDEVKAALSSAGTIAYPDPASGSPAATRFQASLAKLKLDGKLNARLRVLPDANAVARALAAGEAELGIGMANDIVNRPGITLAGFLPHSLQKWITIRAVRLSDSEPARAFLDYISDDDTLKLFARGGFH